MTPVMVHMVQAEKDFFSLDLRGGGRVLPYWWHHGDAYLGSYLQERILAVQMTFQRTAIGSLTGCLSPGVHW